MGRSDRSVAFDRAERRSERTIAAVEAKDGLEDTSATRAVLVAMLRQRALFLGGRRDHEIALATAAEIVRLDPNDQVAAEVKKRFADLTKANAPVARR